jgi:hypothetical protein
MQTLPQLLTWPEVFRSLVFTAIGLIPYFVTTYRNRKKSDLDNKEAEARTELAKANVRSVEIRDGLAAGESVGKLVTALMESGDIIHDQQNRIFKLEQGRVGEDMLWLDLKKATALLAYHSIPFHTAEHPAVKRLVEKLIECEPPFPPRAKPMKQKLRDKGGNGV